MMNLYRATLSLFLILGILTLANCSKIPTEKIYKKPENKIPQTKKDKPAKKPAANSIIVEATEDRALDATLFAVKWIKWKIFSENYDNGTISLKEAYVYTQDGKLKRIYHWPPKDSLPFSNISGYLKKVVIPDSQISFNDVAFTQENMKIYITDMSDGKMEVTADYIIFPYMKNLELGPQLKSSLYIEDILFSKIREYLNNN